MAAAVRAGKIKGVVHENKDSMLAGKPGHPDVDVNLTDSSANLVRFLQTADLDQLFSTKLDILYRVELAGK